MNRPLLTTLALTALIFGYKANAMEFDKPITASIVTNKPVASAQAGFSRQSLPLKKTVTLMKIKLTAQQRQLLRETGADNTQTSQNYQSKAAEGLPRQFEVSMNGTPVLDQGQHGTCATFANTAAIDALLGKGDYISQLCHLELGSYFEEKGYLPSGWDGSVGPFVLNQIIGFGIINKSNQKSKSCGGLKDYPASPYNLGTGMNLDEFKQASENLNETLDWQPLLTFTQRFEWSSNGEAQAEALLTEVKKVLALKRPHEDARLSFGSLLPVAYCSAGACARYHAENDTWALTSTIKKDNDPQFGGHEMVIIGYNDDAVAVDNEGGKHKGLLTLRNSWGSDAGDQGNYYMSYDFFKRYVLEVQKIMLSKD